MKHLLKIISQEISTLNSLIDHVQSVDEINDMEIDLALRKVNDIYNELLMLKSSDVSSLKNLNEKEKESQVTPTIEEQKTTVTETVQESIAIIEKEGPVDVVVVSVEPEVVADPEQEKEIEKVSSEVPVIEEIPPSSSEEKVESSSDESEITNQIDVANKDDSSKSDLSNEQLPVESHAESENLVEEELISASDKNVDNQNEFAVEKESISDIESEGIPSDTNKEEVILPQEIVEEETKVEAVSIVEEHEEVLLGSESVSEEASLDEKNAPFAQKGSVFADRFNDKSPSFNDMQASLKRSKDLASQFADRPIFHLKSAVKINDRIWFVNELFNRDVDLYNETLSKIDAMNNLDEALAFLFQSFQWDQEKKSTINFLELIFRRFANQK